MTTSESIARVSPGRRLGEAGRRQKDRVESSFRGRQKSVRPGAENGSPDQFATTTPQRHVAGHYKAGPPPWQGTAACGAGLWPADMTVRGAGLWPADLV